ncbi:MAG: HEAT repeat domain-containing protein, partial [Alphaproteobacteria bacterium]|nr:HEAT repeat domain-containing protein [Alphaproteobacteria bacterium]
MRPIIELLSDYTGAEQEQRVRTNACVALGAVATSEAMEHLFRLGLTDASEEVRESAAREIAKAPSQLRTPLIHRLYDGSEKRGEWRSNFELLQSIGAISGKLEPRPGDWLRRVLQILVLNFRIIATRGNEFSFWPRLKLGSLFVALFCSAIVVTIWSLLAFERLFDEDWAAVLAMIFGLWIPFVVYP